MNRLYSLSTDGRIFYADPQSKSFELLEPADDSLTIRDKIKHISSSDWCLWTVTSNLKLDLFVFQSDTPYEYQEIVYENQVPYIYI